MSLSINVLRKLCYYLIGVATSCFTLSAQQLDIAEIDLNEVFSLPDQFVYIFEDTTSSLSFEKIGSLEFQEQFTVRKKNRKYDISSTIWIRFTLKNSSNNSTELVATSNDWDVQFFSKQTEAKFFKERQGVLSKSFNGNFYNGENADGKIKIHLEAGDIKTYYIKTPGVLQGIAFKSFDFVNIVDKETSQKKSIFDLWSISIYVGILFLILVASVYLLVTSFRISYLFYLLYSLFHVLFFTGYFQIPSLFSFKWPISHSIFLPMAAVLYLLFVNSYLKLRAHNPKISLLFRTYIGLLLVAILTLLVLNFVDMALYYAILPKINITNLFFLAFITFLITKNPGKLKYFILTGTAFIVVGATFTWITQYSESMTQSFLFAISGNAFEKIAFLFGIFYVYNKEHRLAETKLVQTQKQLEFNEQQLLNFSKSIKEKNKLIETFEKQIAESGDAPDKQQENLLQLSKSIILTDQDWEDFKKLYEEAHPGFFFNLKYKHADLTNAEIRLIALMKLQLSNKEIGGMLGISPESVIKTKYRLKKKLVTSENEDLDALILQL